MCNLNLKDSITMWEIQLKKDQQMLDDINEMFKKIEQLETDVEKLKGDKYNKKYGGGNTNPYDCSRGKQ